MTEVSVNNLDKPSVVAASLIQTLSWHERSVKKITTAEPNVMEDVLVDAEKRSAFQFDLALRLTEE